MRLHTSYINIFLRNKSSGPGAIRNRKYLADLNGPREKEEML